MRRPGLWVAIGQPKNVAQMYRWQPGAVASYFDDLQANQVANYKATHPDVPVLVRFQHPRNWQQDPTGWAKQLGQQIASKWSQLKALDPYVCFASRMNMHYENGDPNPAHQPRYTRREFYQKYANWVRLTADVIKNDVPEMKLITPPFAFGFNEDGSPDANGEPINGWAGYDFLQQTVQDYFDNTLSFHAYWGYPAGGSVPDWLYLPELSSWYAFRWQRVLQMFERRYGIKARIFIDEVSSFGPADPDFTDQLIYYAEQCLTDTRVIGLTYFLWSDSTNNPFYRPHSWAENIPNLERHLSQLKALHSIKTEETPDKGLPPDAEIDTNLSLEALVQEDTETGSQPATTEAEVEAKTLRVLFEDGSVQVMAVEEYLRAVVPSEVPAHWPAEAVRAQAIAARGYAYYAKEHPRHAPHADICTTTHCQHYNPAKIHPNSDDAIRQTQGQVILYQGQIINTVYSARCGGHTRNNEDVWKGRAVPYLRGVPCPDKGEQRGHGVGFCQYGARTLANQGQSYQEILSHYYQGAAVGRPQKG